MGGRQFEGGGESLLNEQVVWSRVGASGMDFMIIISNFPASVYATRRNQILGSGDPSHHLVELNQIPLTSGEFLFITRP